MPTEILATIFRFCSHTTAKNLQIVNEEFGDLGAAVVFKAIFVMCKRWSIENLAKIARASHLSKLVRRIILVTGMIKHQIADLLVWKQYALHVCTNELSPFAKERFLVCQNLVAEDRELMNDEWKKMQVMNMLWESLQLLTELDSMRTISLRKMHSICLPRDDRCPILGRLSRLTLVPAKCFFESLHAGHLMTENLSVGVRQKSWEDRVKALLFGQQPRFKYLSSNTLFLGTCSILHNLFNLQKLELEIKSIRYTLNQIASSNDIRHLTAMLTSASQLEVLVVTFTYPGDSSRIFDMSEVLAPLTMRRLRVIALKQCAVHPLILIGFLERHAISLKSLSLLQRRSSFRISPHTVDELRAMAALNPSPVASQFFVNPVTADWKPFFMALAPIMELNEVNMYGTWDKEAHEFWRSRRSRPTASPQDRNDFLEKEEMLRQQLYLYLLQQGKGIDYPDWKYPRVIVLPNQTEERIWIQ